MLRADDAPDDPVAAAFAALDADGDKRLSLEEIRRRQGAPEKHERDFRLFDMDADGRLTRVEFSRIPGTGPASRRGALPDPFDDLLTVAVAAMDETYGGWDRNPQLLIPSQQFVTDFLNSLVPGASTGIDPAHVRPLSDPDGNGRVTREEARRFLEIQLGIRWIHGESLREPGGRVPSVVTRYIWVDADASGGVSAAEFVARWMAEDAPHVFRNGDRNGDGQVTFDEFLHPEWIGYEDPVETFLGADTDWDGLLDLPELREGTIEPRRPLVPATFRAFDLDGSGKLSLDEFRVSPLGATFCGWELVPTDTNRDGAMSFDEFTFGHAPCHLLRRFYFHRFDADADGKLSADEFPFRRNPPHGFHVLSADGTGFRRLYVNEEYPNCGSPALSPDGKLIAFDGYRGGEGLQQSRILLINADGSGFRDLCEGLMPTWSRDGRQLACSRYRGGSGVWIINADGTDAKRIGNGWGAQWSPDGRTIAYTQGRALWVYDVEAGTSREFLAAAAHPYQYIYYNMSWSSDSRRLAFRADRGGGSDIVSVSMEGDDRDLKVHHSTEKWFDADIAWSPDGKRILLSAHSDEHKRNVLHEIDTEAEGPPKVVEGIDTKLNYYGVCCRSDRQGFILVTQE